MALYLFSALTNNQTLAFDPTADQLVFDTPGTSAAGLVIGVDATGSNLSFLTAAGKTVLLSPAIGLRTLTSANISFNDGSRLVVGDNTVATTADDGANTLVGTNFNDQLLGLGGNDSLSGGTGDDLLDGGAGNDLLDGGTGIDTASYVSAPAAVTVNLALTTAQNTVGAGSDTLRGIEILSGSRFDDTLSGDALANNLFGNSGNDLLAGGNGDDLIDGGAGTDTASYATASAAVTVNLAIATRQATGGAGGDVLRSIENLRGSSFADSLTGSVFGNTIEGGPGNDILDGAGGIDTLSYANALSAVSMDLGSTVLQPTFGAGDDTVRNFENLTGSRFADTLIGTAGSNRIDGGAGIDRMSGGAGSDIYVVDNTSDVITEAAAAGTDSAQASASFVLPANVENLLLTGAAAINGTGNALANEIQGNAAANSLDGGTGTDTLSYSLAGAAVTVNLGLTTAQATGGGGTDTITGFENLTGSRFADNLTGSAGSNVLNGSFGADALSGLGGNDTYVIDNTGDTITEGLGGGTDTVQSSITFILGNNLENLTLLGPAAINGTGNSAGNTITGNVGNNALSGLDGNDVLEGGAGNDSLAGGLGIDTASYASAPAAVTVDLTLGAGQNTGGAGVDTLSGIENLTGSRFNDTLIGDGGNNSLDGRGGQDSLSGGLGNDTYSLDVVGETVTEASGAGIDTVRSSVSYNLPVNVENLILVASKGVTTINGTGNADNNVLTGTNGNNTLDGGAGIDTVSYAGQGGGLSLSGVRVDLNTSAAQDTGGAGTDSLIRIENIIGTSFADTLIGNGAANTLTGGGGNDTLTGGGGADIFVFNNTAADTLTDFSGVSVGAGTPGQGDKMHISQASLRIGNGNTVIDGAQAIAGPGGFAPTVELVIITGSIPGVIDATSAAAAIGSATAAYAAGQTALFAVTNGVDSALFGFLSSTADATVSAAELSLRATLSGATTLTSGDFAFVS